MDRLPEGVSWTQTPDDVEVYFPVPAETVRTNLEVSISHNQLEVVAPGKKRMNVMLANAHIVDSAVWMFSGEGEDRTVVIHLEKREQQSWTKLCVGDADEVPVSKETGATEQQLASKLNEEFFQKSEFSLPGTRNLILGQPPEYIVAGVVVSILALAYLLS
mmetsp:Transcript_49169/g.96392  ORF Transcript_49169/g.96392 Transcript_49169/m.96392 type:complete len:161 (+) Transcript_49169:35-517(+)